MRQTRVAVALRLGLGLCAAHTCRCGSQVDTWASTLSCIKWHPVESQGTTPSTTFISRAFASAKIPVTKEPSGLFRSDGKRPDGLMLIPWQRGLSPTWDVTVARWQTPQLAPQLKWRLPENKPSTPHCQGRTCSSRLVWKLCAQSRNPLCNA